MKIKKALVFLLILLSAIFLFLFKYIWSFENVNINEKLSENPEICIATRANCGSTDDIALLTIKCKKLNEIESKIPLACDQNIEIFNNKIDSILANSCKKIRYKDFNSDNEKEILSEQNKFCLWLRHPHDLKKPLKEAFRIDRAGNFIPIRSDFEKN